MKVSFFDIIEIAPFMSLKTEISNKLISLIIMDEKELRLFSGKNSFLVSIKNENPDIDESDLYDDYIYISKLLRGIKYNFLKYDNYLKTKHLYPDSEFEFTYPEIDIDYIGLYEKHKYILTPDDLYIRIKPADSIVDLNSKSNIDNLFNQAIIDVYKEYYPNLTDKEINEQIKKDKL